MFANQASRSASVSASPVKVLTISMPSPLAMTDGAAEALLALRRLELGVRAEADRIQAEIVQLLLDIGDLPVGRGVGIDVLEPALDRADLAVAIPGGGQPFECLLQAVRGEDDGRAEDRRVFRHC